jgi:hypothetical protein
MNTLEPVTRHHLLAPLLAVLLLAAAAGVGLAQSIPQSRAVDAFTVATREYAEMHRRLERALAPAEVNSSVESINRTVAALAAAIRAERPDARQGDFFTLALAHELRARVNDALLEHGFTVADIFANEGFEGIDPATVRLRVNGAFPWALASMMFPCVIEALPPLPPELQYRIVSNALVLIDVHASLIVDILPNVLADVTVRNSRPEGAVR